MFAVQRKAVWTATAILLALFCSGQSWADTIRLQGEVTSADDPGQKTRQLWEITGTSVSLNGTQQPAWVKVSDSLIELKQEYLDHDTMMSATVRIDRPSGKIALTVIKTRPDGASTSETMLWAGTCSVAAAPLQK
jgi:hypothetical protein